ncbi:MAG: hybrid sensor histidine kinase/response regulator [Deltaproteobacteria bacterium]|nr:hybrid sensor histidine kinase/response regulator [Deltaproteobacteria bacterium]
MTAWPRLPGERLRVLAWEPHPDHAVVIAHALEDAGQRAELASTREEALERARQGGHDAWVLPGDEAGLEVVRLLRRSHAQQPIVVLTPGSEDGIRAALEAGATDVLMRVPGYELPLPSLVAQSIHRDRTHHDLAPRLAAMAERVAELEDQVRALRSQLEVRTSEMEVARRGVQDAYAQRSTMLANVSHELRTPLTTILGFTGVLQDRTSGPITAEQEQQLELIRKASIQLLALINDVLEMARLEAGQAELVCLPVDVGALLRDCAEGLADQLRGRQVAVDVRLQPCRVESDPTRLRQAIWNLCQHAARTTLKGSITLDLQPAADGGVTLRVTDTSPGMGPEDLALLFEKFHHMPPTRRKVSRMGGLTRGLGIPLAADLARALGGKLAAASTIGVGTTFTLELPPRSPPPTPRR